MLCMSYHSRSGFDSPFCLHTETNLFFRGLRDGLSGVFGLHKLHKLDHRSTRSSSAPVLTELQRRRLAKEAAKDDTDKAQNSNRKHNTIQKRILQCCLLNGGVFLFSNLLFQYLLLPILHFSTNLLFSSREDNVRASVWSWIFFVASWLFSVLWIVPLYLLSRAVSSLWFEDIASAISTTKSSTPACNRHAGSIGSALADMAFGLLVKGLFLVQAQVTSIFPIPVIDHLAFLFHMSILNSLCAFDYTWARQGWEVTKRLIVVEAHWPYFLGFGLPITLLTSSCGSYWISGCAFSILFPLLIISAELAKIPPTETTVNLPIFLTTVAVANFVMSSLFNSSPSNRDMSAYSFHRIRLLLGRGFKNSLPCFKRVNGRALLTTSAVYHQESQPFLPQKSEDRM